MNISGDLTDIPFRVKRKVPDKRKQIKDVLHVGFKIEQYKFDNYYGCEVNGDNLFLLSDFTVVHNCYKILLEELAEYHPVMYTGTESSTQKEKSKQAFLNGETNCFIISLRSGIGLDGLQARCNTVVIAELDWSPKVMEQLIGRVDRDGQQEQVTAIFLVSDCGSDPLIIDMLGVKSSQSHGILNPLDSEIQEQYTDETRIKLLAQKYLEKKTGNKYLQTKLFS
ncbi:MAG: C-terminal helicase domain-containing protein [Paludibacter sp.]|nr:C-terminal helicase domain-containing protein [Paludibacter sp.]